MTALLRAGSIAVNVLVPVLAARLLGAGWWGGAGAALALLAASLVYSLHRPAAPVADEPTVADARRAAERMGAPPPRFVRVLPGWMAGAVRVRGGYGLYLGADVAAEHRERVCAHEIAHFLTGDLAWEFCTDGPGRMLLDVARRVPPLVVIAVPFLLLGAPLARRTELRADRLATDRYPDFPELLRDVGAKMGHRSSVLYPSLDRRVRSARGLR